MTWAPPGNLLRTEPHNVTEEPPPVTGKIRLSFRSKVTKGPEPLANSSGEALLSNQTERVHRRIEAHREVPILEGGHSALANQLNELLQLARVKIRNSPTSHAGLRPVQEIIALPHRRLRRGIGCRRPHKETIAPILT
jgi:hypothetical protein